VGVKAFVVSLVAAAALAACGGSTPPPSAPSPGAPASAASKDNPNRALSPTECQSLGQMLAEACQTRPNERSARVEGWCTDLLRGVEDGSWAAGDCRKHIKYMDAECLRSAANVHILMDCDKGVDRSQ
jgi:hypothetical protein